MVTRTPASDANRFGERAADSGDAELERVLDEAVEEYGAKQDRSELRTIAHIVSDVEPETVVEIGTASGGSLYVWNKYLDSAQVIISVDKDHTPRSKARCEAMDAGTDVECVEGVSQDPAVVDAVEDHVYSDGIDFLFIDGGSSEREVLADYQNFGEYVNDGGVVAFHDIRTHEERPEAVAVEDVWEAVRSDAEESVEVVKSTEATEYGYGVMYF